MPPVLKLTFKFRILTPRVQSIGFFKSWFSLLMQSEWLPQIAIFGLFRALYVYSTAEELTGGPGSHSLVS